MIRLAEWASLAVLVTDGDRHGWAVARELRPDGSLGRIWHASRAVTYRSLDALVDRCWVAEAGAERGVGPQRTILRATAEGRDALEGWVATPAEHLRDLRSELLMRLVVADRLQQPTGTMLAAQQRIVERVIVQLERGATGGTTVVEPEFDLVAEWRLESARAAHRFITRRLVAR